MPFSDGPSSGLADKVGHLRFEKNSTPDWSGGQRGWSMFFDYSTAENIHYPGIVYATRPFSVTAWVYPIGLSTGDWKMILVQDIDTPATNYFGLFLNTAGYPAWR